MSQANIRVAGQSILGAVTESANAVGNIFSAAGGAASMLNSYVKDAQSKQRIRMAVGQSDYAQFFMEEHAIECAERSLLIEERKKQNPLLESLFNEHKERIDKVIAELNG